MPNKNLGWTQVGEVGVDAGLLWLGDPCYILHREEGPPACIGNSWDEFCSKLKLKERVTVFNYDMGHAGLGVCVSTGYGDGCYPVFVKKNEEGRIMEVKVVF